MTSGRKKAQKSAEFSINQGAMVTQKLRLIAAAEKEIDELKRELTLCGCYHCLARFQLSEVVEKTKDGDLICPKCSIDSVILGPVSKQVLEMLQKDKFTNSYKEHMGSLNT